MMMSTIQRLLKWKPIHYVNSIFRKSCSLKSAAVSRCRPARTQVRQCESVGGGGLGRGWVVVQSSDINFKTVLKAPSDGVHVTMPSYTGQGNVHPRNCNWKKNWNLSDLSKSSHLLQTVFFLLHFCFVNW